MLPLVGPRWIHCTEVDRGKSRTEDDRRRQFSFGRKNKGSDVDVSDFSSGFTLSAVDWCDWPCRGSGWVYGRDCMVDG